jgi:peptide/nickel transport system permease protein
MQPVPPAAPTELELLAPDAVVEADGAARDRRRWVRLRAVRRSRSALIGLVMIAILLVLAAAGGLFAPYDPLAQSFMVQLQGPSFAHLFGTDQFGRDIFSRVLYGARPALLAGLVANGIATVCGVLIGLVAGFYGRWVDNLLMRITDVMLSFPYLLLALIVVSILGPGLTSAVVAIGIAYLPQFARLVRGAVLEVMGHQYLEAARALGVPGWQQMWRHVLLNVLGPITVMVTLTVGLAIAETAGLSFLGLGAVPPAPDWGAMLSDGREYMLSAPWIATFPGAAILFTVLGFNLLGDGLRDVLDPKLRR